MEDIAIRAKRGTTEILRKLKKIGCNSPVTFFKPFDAQIAAEIWGYKMYEEIERVHLFASKRILCVTRLRMTLSTDNWAIMDLNKCGCLVVGMTRSFSMN